MATFKKDFCAPAQGNDDAHPLFVCLFVCLFYYCAPTKDDDEKTSPLVCFFRIVKVHDNPQTLP